MIVARASLAVAVAAALAGCAGMSEQACLTSDWRTVGFEDGTLGRTVGTIGSYRQQCAEHGVAPDLDAYRAGHAEGVQTYCREGHGFEVGRSGAAYQGVCPVDLEANFLAAYNTGRHLYELESALQRVVGQLASNRRAQDDIKKELTAIATSMVSDETTAEQRVAFVARSAEIGQRYGELTAQIQTLEAERAVRTLELDDYRQTLAATF
jgi:hypothetical protein